LSQSKTVLLLGRKNSNVDESFEWDYQSTPNIYEPDIILVDLTTLTKETLTKNAKKYEELTQMLLNKFLNQGLIIFITTPRFRAGGYIYSEYASNYFLSPIEFGTREITAGKKLIYDLSHPFKNYLLSIERYSFHLILKSLSPFFKKVEGSNPSTRLFLQRLNSNSYKNVYNTEFQNYEIQMINASLATDNSNNILSVGYQIQAVDINGINELSGKVFYLPPSNLPSEEYINLILTDLGISEVQEIFPDWIHQVKIAGLDLIESNLQDLYKKRNQLNNSINVTEQSKEKLQGYYNLILSHGSILENAVNASFKELGFDDINNDRGKECEDWRFEFKTGTAIKYGLIEVHGTQGGISLDKINQCKKWVDDYAIKFQEDAKGIFIVNQHRSQRYPESLKKRNDFHPDHIKFAKERKICMDF
jgi:hypothetical protein